MLEACHHGRSLLWLLQMLAGESCSEMYLRSGNCSWIHWFLQVWDKYAPCMTQSFMCGRERRKGRGWGLFCLLWFYRISTEKKYSSLYWFQFYFSVFFRREVGMLLDTFSGTCLLDFATPTCFLLPSLTSFHSCSTIEPRTKQPSPKIMEKWTETRAGLWWKVDWHKDQMKMSI